MSINRQSETITLTPSRWKWVIGAIFVFALPGLGFLLSGLFLAIAFGSMHRLTLRPYGFELRRWGKTTEYRWSEVGSFEVHTFRYMFIPLLRRVTFTPVAKEGKLLTRASKIISGGTERIPAIGMGAKEQAILMNEYRDAYIAQHGPQKVPSQDVFEPNQQGRPSQVLKPRPASPQIVARQQPARRKLPKASAGVEALGRGQKQNPLVQDSASRKWRTRG